MENRYLIYLLHFDQPVQGKAHYMGICQSHRLHKRCQEHARGTGAALTRAAYLAGIGFTVAATFRCDDPDKEKRLKRQSHFDKRCAICRGAGPPLPLDGQAGHYDPTKTPQGWRPAGWMGSGIDSGGLSLKKGEDRSRSPFSLLSGDQ